VRIEKVKEWFPSEETETKIKLEYMSRALMPFLFLDESHGAQESMRVRLLLFLGEM